MFEPTENVVVNLCQEDVNAKVALCIVTWSVKPLTAFWSMPLPPNTAKEINEDVLEKLAPALA